MWREMARIIGEVRPRFAFVENSPMLVTRGLERVLADFTAMGYDSRWGVISASDIGAKHKRERIWIVANSKHSRHSDKIGGVDGEKVGLSQENRQERSGGRMLVGTSDLVSKRTASRIFNENVAYTSQIGLCGKETKQRMAGKFGFTQCGVDRNWWEREPANVPRTIERNMGGMVDGLASRVDRLKAIGNGQVPLCAATAWKILSERI